MSKLFATLSGIAICYTICGLILRTLPLRMCEWITAILLGKQNIHSIGMIFNNQRFGSSYSRLLTSISQYLCTAAFRVVSTYESTFFRYRITGMEVLPGRFSLVQDLLRSRTSLISGFNASDISPRFPGPSYSVRYVVPRQMFTLLSVLYRVQGTYTLAHVYIVAVLVGPTTGHLSFLEARSL